MRGNCYVTSEAAYHLLGGKEAGWTPMRMHHEGDTHWFLKHKSGFILDLTVKQFKTRPDYTQAVGSGFLTREPSKRAQKMIQMMLWQETETQEGRDQAGHEE